MNLDRFAYGFDDPQSHDAEYQCDRCGAAVYDETNMTEDQKILCDDCFSDYEYEQEKAQNPSLEDEQGDLITDEGAMPDGRFRKRAS